MAILWRPGYLNPFLFTVPVSALQNLTVRLKCRHLQYKGCGTFACPTKADRFDQDYRVKYVPSKIEKESGSN